MQSLDILQKFFGYSSFRGQQQAIIDHILSGRHALVLMPTGMGKSCCYQIPALMLPGLTVVISPLIALMQDQVDTLVHKNIEACFINSSLDRAEREKRYRAIDKGKYKLLYVTPERFRKPEFIDLISKRQISLLAVDEAHCISQWGHDFRPDYSRIKEFRSYLGNPTTIALTATATPDVQRDIIEQLGLAPHEVKKFHEGINRPNLILRVHDLYGDEQKCKTIVDQFVSAPGNTIVYFALIKTLERFSILLNKQGISHLLYHGGLDKRERRRIQQTFMSGDNNLILATNAFGMGIDKADIRHVLHAEVPGSMEAYYQEIGRAGRDGKKADCTLLYDEQDLLIQMDFIKWNNPDADFYNRLYQILTEDPEAVNAQGTEWLKEKLLFKTKHDFRVETGLSMFDRYGVTEGSIEKHDLRVASPFPKEISQEKVNAKMKNEQKKLHFMVGYIKTEGCRKALIHEYFGIEHPDRCGACDLCLGSFNG
ncbi:MAG: ATP-dependent DNA helicase [Desulfobulbaceae bacterium]|nr:ATP-dependent DNA helicase [Desulfobulbaceae bacterium]